MHMGDVKKRLADFRRKRAKMDMVLSKYVKADKRNVLPSETVNKLTKLISLRRKMVTEEKGLIRYKKNLVQKMSKADRKASMVKVYRAVYSGTTVVVNGYSYHVKDYIMGEVKFILNVEEPSVELIK